MCNNYDDDLTPQEEIEELLRDMENDLNNGKHEVVCEQLPEIWSSYQNVIQGVASLYSRYMELYRRC